jgi:putative tricarboxylic transport membrane protein
MTADRAAGGALVLFGVVVLWESRALPLGTLHNPGPAYLPVVLALLLIALGALVAAWGGASPRLGALGWSEARHAVAILVVGALAALAFERLGYRATMILLLLLLLGGVERRGTALSVALALGLALGTFYLFETLLRVPLPRGPWGF